MFLAAIILISSYALIATERISKVKIAMLGAAITLIAGLVNPEKAFEYVDFKVIFLLVSMMIMVHISKRSGMYRWLGLKILKLTGGNPKFALISLALLTGFLSAVLDNVTTVLLVLPIIFSVTRELELDPFPFLITNIFASNIGGTATLIGDPPNIIIGSAAGLSFMDFVKELTPVISLIMIICIGIMLFVFRKNLVSSPEHMKRVVEIDTSGVITDKSVLRRSLPVLLLVILGFITHDITHIDAYVVAFFGASVLILFESPKRILNDVEWTTIFFFIGLFIIIGGLIEQGGMKLMAEGLLHVTNGSLKATSLIVLWGSGILSGIVDNIPYTATMVPLIKELSATMNVEPLWWSLSLGACLGGNATIIGAAANVIVADAAKADGHDISFVRFMKYGVLITFISLVVSSIYIYFRFLT